MSIPTLEERLLTKAPPTEGEASSQLRRAIERVSAARRTLREAEEALSQVVGRFVTVVEPIPEGGERPLQATILVTPRRRHLMKPGAEDTYCGRYTAHGEPGRLAIDESYASEVVTCPDCLRAAGLDT